MASRYVPLLTRAFWLVIAKGDGEAWSIPEAAIVIPKRVLRFSISFIVRKDKIRPICPGNNLTFTRAISNKFSSHLHRHSVKKAETQQCARTQVNSKKCSGPSYRSRWQLLPQRNLSEDGHCLYTFFHGHE